MASGACAAANALNQYPTVAAYPYSWWPEGGLKQSAALQANYDEQGKLMLAYITATPGVIDPNDFEYMALDGLGHLYAHARQTTAGQSFPFIYHSTDGLRPETVLEWQCQQMLNVPPTCTGIRRYVLGPDPDERWAFLDMNLTIDSPHVDREGTIIALSNDSVVAQKYTYDAYGQSSAPLTDVGPGSNTYAYRFTGQRLDPNTGLYDYKARDYSTTLGRFLQPDPAGLDQGPNLYEYVANDPVNKADPTGMAFGLDDAAGAVLGAIVGVAVQGAEDLATGQKATLGQFTGAAVSGAIIGVGAVNTPETGGLSDVAAAAIVGGIAGGAGDSARQGVDIATGAQRGGFNGGDVARSAAVGAVVGGVTQGAVPKANIPGLSSGRGNMRSVATGVRTRIANGNARNMSARTAVKAAVGSQAANVNRTAASAGADAAKAAACPSQGSSACR